MVNDTEISAWHKAVRAAHKSLGTPPGSGALLPFAAGNQRGRWVDLVVLSALGNVLVERGFTAPYLQGTGWFTKYGPIECRIWWDHGDKSIELCVVARGLAEKADNIEVADYEATIVDDKPHLVEKKFDVATLVLPKH